MGISASKMPQQPSEKMALARALGDISNADVAVRKVPKSQWWQLTPIEKAGENLRYLDGDDRRIKVRLREDWEAREAQGLDVIETDGWCSSETGEVVSTAWYKYRANLTSGDFSKWAPDTLVKAFSAVRTREGGGEYYLPSGPAADLWVDVTRALRSCTDHKFYMIPCFKDAGDLAEKVLDGLRDEVAAFVAGLEGDLQRDGDKALKEAALQTRITEAEARKAKLARYESLFGTSLQEVRDALTKVQASTVQARIVAMSGAYSDK